MGKYNPSWRHGFLTDSQRLYLKGERKVRGKTRYVFDFHIRKSIDKALDDLVLVVSKLNDKQFEKTFFEGETKEKFESFVRAYVKRAGKVRYDKPQSLLHALRIAYPEKASMVWLLLPWYDLALLRMIEENPELYKRYLFKEYLKKQKTKTKEAEEIRRDFSIFVQKFLIDADLVKNRKSLAKKILSSVLSGYEECLLRMEKSEKS
jgi:hypothetical protein